MKTIIATIATSIILAFSFTSCTDDTDAFVQKIEATQTELKQQDSLLVAYRSELSSVAFTDTVTNTNPNDSFFKKLAEKIKPLSNMTQFIEIAKETKDKKIISFLEKLKNNFATQ